MAPAIDGPTRTMPIVLWVLRALMAALFLFAAFAKLSSMQMEVDAFAMLPVGQWFRYLVGLLELAGGISVLIPTISGLGAIVLLVVDVGAFFAQILFLHQDSDSSHRHWSNPRRPHLPAARRHSRTIGDVSLSAAALLRRPICDGGALQGPAPSATP